MLPKVFRVQILLRGERGGLKDRMQAAAVGNIDAMEAQCHILVCSQLAIPDHHVALSHSEKRSADGTKDLLGWCSDSLGVCDWDIVRKGEELTSTSSTPSWMVPEAVRRYRRAPVSLSSSPLVLNGESYCSFFHCPADIRRTRRQTAVSRDFSSLPSRGEDSGEQLLAAMSHCHLPRYVPVTLSTPGRDSTGVAASATAACLCMG